MSRLQQGSQPIGTGPADNATSIVETMHEGAGREDDPPTVIVAHACHALDEKAPCLKRSDDLFLVHSPSPDIPSFERPELNTIDSDGRRQEG